MEHQALLANVAKRYLLCHLQVLLQDVNGNLTDTINVTIAINGVTNDVPEPTIAALFILGCIVFLVAFHRRLIADMGNGHQTRVSIL